MQMAGSKKEFNAYLIYLSFLPAVAVGIRAVYFFELYLLVVFSLILVSSRVLKISYFRIGVVFSALIFILCIPFFQSVLWGNVHSLSILRFFILVTPILFYSYFKGFIAFERHASIFAIIISLIGIFQFVDGFILQNFFKFNNLVGTLWPYVGILDESSLDKVGGAQIKSGSLFRATSIMDGHPILFGDLTALLSVFFLFWRRYIPFMFLAVATLLTFSRGSWLMLVVAIFLFFLFGKKDRNFYFMISIFIASLTLLIMKNELVYRAFYFRVVNTLYSFGLSDVEVGRSNDPRTSEIWPAFIDEMNNIPLSYIFGYNLNMPTDSGYLAILRESGVWGLVFYVSISLFTIFLSRFDKLVLSFFIVLSVGMIFHPITQGYKIVYITSLMLAFYIRFLRGNCYESSAAHLRSPTK